MNIIIQNIHLLSLLLFLSNKLNYNNSIYFKYKNKKIYIFSFFYFF